jgi:hypothetical protein
VRKKFPLKRTYLCAVKFWRTGPLIPTMASGVRHVVRKQGHSSDNIYGMERALEREGLLQVSRSVPRTVALTPRGERRASCRTVRLAPWTDKGYPGSQLEDAPRLLTPAQSRARIQELRRQGCEVTKHRVGNRIVILKECPKKRRKR